MNRELLERMTKEELIKLVERQTQAINSLDTERYDANAVIEHLVMATEGMQSLRHHDAERDHDQEYLDDYVRQMYMEYPTYLVRADKEEQRTERYDDAVRFNFRCPYTGMRCDIWNCESCSVNEAEEKWAKEMKKMREEGGEQNGSDENNSDSSDRNRG